MEILFYDTKSGDKTFSVDNIFFHSKYAPKTEAERFLSANTFEYSPKVIIVVEPGFSYLYSPLKKKYPDSKIGIIRIITQVPDSSIWDFCINFTDLSKESLKSLFTESELLSTQFLCWSAAQKLFSTEIKNIFGIFKESFDEAKSLIITRQYFEKKWLINAFNNIKYLEKYTDLTKKINVPVVITASGPSLKEALPYIKKYSDRIFIICLSSALSVLLKYQIKPDLVLTSDGGFWAGQHLKKLSNIHFSQNNIIALPAEAYIPGSITEQNIILPLSYHDGLTKDFLKICGIKSIKAERNGTVSGTALELARTISENVIYFCGLDLCSSKGFQHTQPNEIEINSQITDNRISTSEGRTSKSGFNSYSLSIYRSWFCQQTGLSQVYRIIEKGSQKSLGNIKDITTEDFENKIKGCQKKSEYFMPTKEISKERKQKILKILFEHTEELLQSQLNLKQLFPLDFISLRHCRNENEKKEVMQRIENNLTSLKNKIKKICGIK